MPIGQSCFCIVHVLCGVFIDGYGDGEINDGCGLVFGLEKVWGFNKCSVYPYGIVSVH